MYKRQLQEEHDMDVITVTVDVGQGDDAKKIAAKAKKLGVKKHYNIDARKEFVDDYIFPAIKENALYQKKYCLATALALTTPPVSGETTTMLGYFFFHISDIRIGEP